MRQRSGDARARARWISRRTGSNAPTHGRRSTRGAPRPARVARIEDERRRRPKPSTTSRRAGGLAPGRDVVTPAARSGGRRGARRRGRTRKAAHRTSPSATRASAAAATAREVRAPICGRRRHLDHEGAAFFSQLTASLAAAFCARSRSAARARRSAPPLRQPYRRSRPRRSRPRLHSGAAAGRGAAACARRRLSR